MNLQSAVILCLLIFGSATAFADDTALSFIGRWYTSPVYDEKLFACEVFTELVIERNKTVHLTGFAIHERDQIKSATQFMHASGTYTDVSQLLRCSLVISEKGSDNVEFTLKKINSTTLELDDGSMTKIMYISERDSPWAEMITRNESK